MIGYLQGKVLDADGKKLLLLTESGIGYEINYSYYLAPQSQAKLFVHHHISENDQSLWGFNSLSDKKMFELLKTVNKVGSSKAYPLVANIGTDMVIQAIMFDQPNVLSQAPGIGKKMAEQIILSLKDKIENFKTSLNPSIEGTTTSLTELPLAPASSQEPSLELDMNIMQEALLALDSLGYKESTTANLVKQQLVSGVNSSEEIIKNVLREM